VVKTTLVDHTNVLNVVILPILNGTVPFTSVKPVDKQHLDMHHEHAMDASMMMEFVAIMISKENTMEILPENVSLHLLFVFQTTQKSNDFSFFLSYLPTLLRRTIRNVSPSCFSFQPHYLSFNQQTLPICNPHQKPYMVSQRRGLVHLP
jgi:hypothetical protein